MTEAMKRSMRVAAGVAVLLLAACGQKGPLYLPDEGGEVVTRPGQSGQTGQPPGESPASPQQQPSPADSEEEAPKQPR